MKKALLHRAVAILVAAAILGGLSSCSPHDDESSQPSKQQPEQIETQDTDSKEVTKTYHAFSEDALEEYLQNNVFTGVGVSDIQTLGQGLISGNADVALEGDVDDSDEYYIAYMCKQEAESSFSLSLSGPNGSRRLILNEACVAPSVAAVSLPIEQFPDATSLTMQAQSDTTLVVSIHEIMKKSKETDMMRHVGGVVQWDWRLWFCILVYDSLSISVAAEAEHTTITPWLVIYLIAALGVLALFVWFGLQSWSTTITIAYTIALILPTACMVLFSGSLSRFLGHIYFVVLLLGLLVYRHSNTGTIDE